MKIADYQLACIREEESIHFLDESRKKMAWMNSNHETAFWILANDIIFLSINKANAVKSIQLIDFFPQTQLFIIILIKLWWSLDIFADNSCLFAF